MTTPTPIATFEDILAAMEQNPQLLAAMRAHVLAQELLTLPARFVELQEQVNRLQETVDGLVRDMADLKHNVETLTGRVDGLTDNVGTLTGRVDTITDRVDTISGTVSRLAGEDYESHVCSYADRFLRRQLGINATVWATQRNKEALKLLLNAAELDGRLSPAEVDDLDEADLIMVSDAPDGHVISEISVTIQQRDVDRAISRAALLAKATGTDVVAIVAGATEEDGLNRRKARVLIVPERPGTLPR